MSPNGLSIVWAPCLMRAPKDVDPMEVLHQLGQQSVCRNCNKCMSNMLS